MLPSPAPVPFWQPAQQGFDHALHVIGLGHDEEADRRRGWAEHKAAPQGAPASWITRGWADFAQGLAGGVAGAIRGAGAASDYYQTLHYGGVLQDAQGAVAPAANLFDQAQQNYAAQTPNQNLLEKGLGILGSIVPAIAAPEAAPLYFGLGGTGQYARDAAARHVTLDASGQALGLLSGAAQGALAMVPIGRLAEGLAPQVGGALTSGALRLAAGTAGSAGLGAVMQVAGNAAEKAGFDPEKDLAEGVAESAVGMGLFHAVGKAVEGLSASEATTPAETAEGPPAAAPESPSAIPLDTDADAAARGAAYTLDRIGQDQAAIGLQRAGWDYEGAASSLAQAEAPPPPAPMRDVSEIGDAADLDRADLPPARPGSQMLYRDAAQGRPIYGARFAPEAVQAAPDLFQYKAGGDAAGVTDRLQGVQTWDPAAAGRSMVWEGPDGGYLIADGHQRLGLAKRLADQSPVLDVLLFRAEDGWRAEDVRTTAALTNIRQGSGTPLDAAKVLRSADAGLNDDSLPLTGEFMTQTRGLARLSNRAFGAVVNEVVPQRHAALIGNMAGERPDLHEGMVDLLHRGRPANMDEARALVGEALEQDWIKREGTSADMFGALPDESTVIPRAKVKAAVLRQLREDQRTFATLTRRADAIEAGGNALAREANEAALATNRAAEALVSKLAMRSGEVGDAMREASEAVAGGARPADAARKVAELVRSAVQTGDDRAVTLAPEAPSPAAEVRVEAFGEPGGAGQAEQLQAKPEDQAREATAEAPASSLFADIRAEPNTAREAARRLAHCAPAAGG